MSTPGWPLRRGGTVVLPGGRGRGRAAGDGETRRTPARVVAAQHTRAATVEALLVFAFFFVGYMALGLYVTVHLQATPFDATARLAHAYFALHGDPSKLAAIGFVWPPVSTLVLLPFTAVSKAGESLWALPMSTATFAAGLLVVLNRTYTLLGIPRWARLTLVLTLGVNPYFSRYASNGMAEMVSLFWVTVGCHYFIKWYLLDRDHILALSGMAWAFAALTRYEIAVYVAFMAVAAGAVLYTRRARPIRVEGALLLFLVPAVYWGGLWVLFNGLITGDFLHFLHEQVRQRFVEYKKTPSADPLEPIRLILSMNARLFTPTLIVIPLMLAVGVLRRNLMAFLLGTLVLINPATTLLAMIREDDMALVQARFNIRSLPLAMIALGWLWTLLPSLRAKLMLLTAAVIIAVAGYPLTLNLMDTFRFQDQRDEARYVEAIRSGQTQRTPDLDIPAARRIATWIDVNAGGRHRVLVDDAQGFAPMLVGGHPEQYYDRIYKGDSRWYKVRDQPRGKVRYLLMTDAKEDLVTARWGDTPRFPWLHLRAREGKYAVYAVDPPPRRAAR